ncbi:cytochrome c maturation protein CcmE [Mesobacillus maritimus]|uniref:cytochrome c maturation protein CcmE n=1 Tax=Mesobacillus maritimus TaxID=1643336 RepID=UPI00203BF622|nr:cytochrome c maturation protein CcmE [Mesobacillus maritimus]MCM3587956.1 cytochrome c maturation protein CcmE [Mesobacillus maritimus]
MSKNQKIITALSLMAAAIIIMTFASMPSAGSKELTISDVMANAEKYDGDYIMTEGLLNKETVQWNADKIELQFEIYDENETKLPVVYKGVQPDNFTEDVIVIVEGFISKNGVFEAEKVMTKCPSKYEGEDMENYDSEMHKEIYKDAQE